MILTERPRKAPISLLLLFIGLLLAQLVVLAHSQSAPNGKDVPLALAPVAALVGIFVIFNMPLRDPMLPKDDISAPYTTPTGKLRTPEDNLTSWQYMTVSWIAPMIQKGVARQLDDEDVWDLGYEFKHSRLHSAFRALQGSVTKYVVSGYKY